MEVEVLSLGGSTLFSDGKINYDYIKKFKKLLTSYDDRKFVVVIGGGTIARLYINALKYFGADEKFQSHFGIAITRTNARMIANAFGKVANNRTLPKSIKEVKSLLRKHKIVFCGGLRYEENQTSDGTSAQIANYLKVRFINITNVKGLYPKDPKVFKNLKLIENISYVDFDKIVNKLIYKPGQHFILDQNASKIIKKHKIKTYIVGKDLKNIKKLLDGKKFVGTVIC
jgi:uridylate kinase